MKGLIIVLAAFVVLIGSTSTIMAGDVTLLHEFAGGNDDGQYPKGSLTLSGSTLYGMTSYGGDTWDGGTVFSIATDGTGFSLLHEFAGGDDDGRYPEGSLTLSGSTLYGMTYGGGDSFAGTVFSIETDGTGFSLLHEFAGGGGVYGGSPEGSLTLSGSTLYGMTSYGGTSDEGTVFSIGTDGTGFSLLHEFVGGDDDGKHPCGNLTLNGSTLYGMTPNGGDSNIGTLFSIGTDGTGFSLLHEFAGGGDDGAWPHGSLTLSGSTLYGTTLVGGNSGRGTVFSIGTDGTGFSLLHEFADNDDPIAGPRGSLTLSGSTLFGMTSADGNSSAGTVFSVGTDGTGFRLLHQFAGGDDDGRYPEGSLTLGGSILYGTTRWGGDSSGGTVFSISVPEPSTFVLLGMGALGILAFACRRRKRC